MRAALHLTTFRRAQHAPKEIDSDKEHERKREK